MLNGIRLEIPTKILAKYKDLHLGLDSSVGRAPHTLIQEFPLWFITENLNKHGAEEERKNKTPRNHKTC